ncbi:MAG: DMT family transporter [Flavobacteriales bacterium]|nr:DMT family transporter [Flavobacteriales bacterium]MDG1765577.1 DMT family transporter [Flavobacteriales bacterium]
MMSKYKYLILLHLIVFIFGFTGILGELITLPAVNLVFFRCLIAMVVIFLFALLSKRIKRFDTITSLKMLGIGVLTAIHWILFFASIKLSTVSVAVSIMASTALWVALFEPLVTKRKILASEIILGVMVIIGLMIIFSFETKYILGLSVALISAMFAAVFSTFNAQMVKRIDSVNLGFYEMTSATVVVGAYLLLKGEMSFDISTNDVLWLLVLGIVATAFAFVISIEVMKELSPFTVGLTINLEPIYTIILALIIFGSDEKMTWGFYVGTAILILAIFLDTLVRRRAKKALLKAEALQAE